MKPRIAIPTPTTLDAEYNRRCLPLYLDALTQSGAVAVEIPLTLSPIEQAALADSCQGVLLPGSLADVDPARYGQPREPACAPADPAREEVDLLLLRDAETRHKPVFGICYGLQLLNVWRGGTLLQDLLPQPINHPAGPAVAIAHTVAIVPGTLLAELADESDLTHAAGPGQPRLSVNSSHHQAVAQLGQNLRVTARSAADNVVEAIESTDTSVRNTASPLLFAVQWHPERSFAISATSRRLFQQLVTRAGQLV